MLQAGQVDRDVAAIVLPAWGRVVPTTDVTAWAVVDEGAQVQPITGYLREFVARGNRTSSVRSYAYVLLRWWRFLIAVDVAWNRATAAEARDLALWLRKASKPVAGRRTTSAATAGTVNPITRKRYLGDEYAARTYATTTRSFGPSTSSGSSRGPDRCSTRCRWTGRGIGAGRMRTTTRCSRSGRTGGCATTRRYPSGVRGRCQTRHGMSCSRP